MTRRSFAHAIALILALVVVACTTVTTTDAPSTRPGESSRATPSPRPSPSPSTAALLDVEDLPNASLSDEGATLICDPEANQLHPDAGDTVILCYDGLLLGLRALRTAVPTVERLYLRRQTCAQVPCSASELSVVQVTGWANGSALTTTIDAQAQSVTVPFPDVSVAWPTVASDAPPVERPVIDGAPGELVHRDPYPFCGDATKDVSAATCFLAAVLAARPAELWDLAAVAQTRFVLRFDGQGLVTRYRERNEGWVRERGSVVLGPEGTWALDNWESAVAAN